MLKQMYTAPFPFPFRDKNLDTRILLSLTKLNEEYLELLYMGLMSMCASKLVKYNVLCNSWSNMAAQLSKQMVGAKIRIPSILLVVQDA